MPGDVAGADDPDTDASVDTEATVKVCVGDERLDRGRRGQRPGQRPRRRAAGAIARPATRSLQHLHLIDFKVRVLDASAGTGAVTRVLIDSTNGERTWSTIGVSENVIEASWQALSDAVVWLLLHS